MEVILKENFPSLGYVGDKVKVRSGYARNFLIPRGIALEASSRNAKLLAHRMQGVVARKIKLKSEAEELAAKLAPVVLEYTLKAGEGGKFFGSVHAKDVEASLAGLGFKLSKTQIKLQEAIKKAGEYKASVKLHSEVVVEIPLKVAVEAVKAKEPAEGAPKKEKKARGGKKAKGEDAASAEEKRAAEAETPAVEAAVAEKPKKERKKKEPEESEGEAARGQGDEPKSA